MFDLFENILAERKGGGGWGKLLGPIVIMVVYALIGLAKAKAEKQKKAKFEEEHAKRGKGQYKPTADSARTEEKRQQDEAARQSRPEPGIRTISAHRQRDERQEATIGIGHRQETTVTRYAAARQAGGAEIPIPQHPVYQRAKPIERQTAQTIASRVAKKDANAPSAATVKTKEAAPVSLAELGRSDNLQKAIVYAEILGRPIALRQ